VSLLWRCKHKLSDGCASAANILYGVTKILVNESEQTDIF